MSINADLTPQGIGDEETKRNIAEQLGAMCVNVRQRRQPREERWLNNHACWRGERNDRAMFHSDTFKHYIPVVRRAIERAVVRGVQMLVPSPTFFEVYPGHEYDTMQGLGADSVRAYMQFLLTNKIKIKRITGQLFRCLALYHRAIVKNTLTVTDQNVSWAGYQGRLQEVWPHTRVVDPFAFYVWPETATDMSEAVLIFEDVMLPYAEYQQYVQLGVTDDIPRGELTAPEWPRHLTRRLASEGLSEPSAIGVVLGPDGTTVGVRSGGTVEPAGTFVALTEAWFTLRGQYRVMAWLVWNAQGGARCVRLQLNPYPEPPYRMTLDRSLPGEHYTSGVMDDLEPLQILFNDQVNASEEARVLTTFPPIAVDRGRVPRTEQIKWGVRKVWNVADPTAIRIMEVADVGQSSNRAVAQTLGLINALGVGGGLSEAQPTRGLPRAGYAVSNLISLAMADIKSMCEAIEEDVLTPTLHDLHRLTLAFVPRTQLIMIPGTQDYPPRAIDVSQIEGNWNLVWVGSQQNQDIQGRSERMIQFLSGLGKVEPSLMRLGWKINWPPLTKRAWRDGLGERGIEQFIVPMTPEELMMAQGMGMPVVPPRDGPAVGAGAQPMGPQGPQAPSGAPMGANGAPPPEVLAMLQQAVAGGR